MNDYHKKGVRSEEYGSFEYSPTIHGLVSERLIKIQGQSIMCNAMEEYGPFFKWYDQFLAQKPTGVRLEFWMEYYNTVSSKIFSEIITTLSRYSQENGAEASVYWYCSENDLDSEEDGELLQNDANMNFEIIVLPHQEWEEKTSTAQNA